MASQKPIHLTTIKTTITIRMLPMHFTKNPFVKNVKKTLTEFFEKNEVK